MTKIKKELSELKKEQDAVLLSGVKSEEDKISLRNKNPRGDKAITLNGRTSCWCKKNCHPKPTWCLRKNCISKANFEKKIHLSNKFKIIITEDFKLALEAVKSEDDYEVFKKNF